MFSYFPMTTLPAIPQTFHQHLPFMRPSSVGAPINMRASTVNMRASVMMSSMDCILPGGYGRGAVYLGDLDAAINYQSLLANNITAVLTVAAYTNISYTPYHGIEHMVIEADDDPRFNLKQYFETAINFIGETIWQCINSLFRWYFKKCIRFNCLFDENGKNGP